ncbi:MAG: hypothetical protein NTU41_08490 [Chloroflexi bacterium]|nr:hypothetical protein [Chloroflexota bacterium]
MKSGVRVVNEDGEPIAVFYSVKREGSKLVVDGKALDVMRMDMIFTSEEIFKAMRMAISWDVFCFVLLLPYFGLKQLFRRSPKSSEQAPDSR